MTNRARKVIGYSFLLLALGCFTVVILDEIYGFVKFGIGYETKSFQPRINEYLSMDSLPTDSGRRMSLRPGIVVVDVNKRNLSTLHWEIASETRAHGPEEVRTIVLLRSIGREFVANYQISGASAYRSLWEVLVVDKELGEIVETRKFAGEPSESRNVSPKEEVGGMPSSEIITYINSRLKQEERR